MLSTNYLVVSSHMMLIRILSRFPIKKFPSCLETKPFSDAQTRPNCCNNHTISIKTH